MPDALGPIRRALSCGAINPDLLSAAERLRYESNLRRREANEAIRAMVAAGTAIRETVRRTGRSRKLDWAVLATARDLIERFHRMLRSPTPDVLPAWPNDVSASMLATSRHPEWPFHQIRNDFGVVRCVPGYLWTEADAFRGPAMGGVNKVIWDQRDASNVETKMHSKGRLMPEPKEAFRQSGVTKPSLVVPRAGFTVRGASEWSGLSRSALYREAGAGRLVFRKAGRTTIVDGASLAALVASLPVAAIGPDRGSRG
ncbi:hypothetical protein [Falsiroseomonas sp. E2-1-a20]|uniref:hypothetical protein n=1 Tax=Falsiroseomonas sp. E2-1-a20 TaxID=3239300 RepID=UPI003F352A73